MPAPTVRVDHESLAAIAKVFGRESDEFRKLGRRIKQTMQVLQNGDWRGQGAAKFFQEMESRILPSVKRLESGLTAARKTTERIAKLMKQAEQEAARLFKVGAAGSLGDLSERYETGGRGAGTVSTGRGDRGGASYGLYQLTSSNGGRVAEFLASTEGSSWAQEFKGLTPGTKEFSDKWKEVAESQPTKFGAAQHDYIARTHYVPVIEGLEQRGFDASRRSEALREVIWSTSVQHGPGTSIVRDVIFTGVSHEDVSDRQIIEAIYAERGRTDANGVLVHFSRNSVEVQRGVANRFKSEMADAVRMLESEQAAAK